MRRLTHFDSAPLGQGFLNVLEKKNIEAHLTENQDGTHSVWILDDENLKEASLLLKEFQKNPTEGAASKKKAEKETRHRQVDVRTQVWQQDEPNRFLTVILMLISGFVYLGQEGGFPSSVVAKLHIADPVYQTPFFGEILAGEFWRLISPIFLHFNMIHILFNMLWLYQLGSMIETIEGSKKLFWLVMVAGVLSNILQYTVTGPAFGGMSGVVYGLLSYAWGMGQWNPQSGYFIDKGTFGFMMVWLVLCFLGIFGPVANFSHLGGFLVGIFWARRYKVGA